MPRTARIAPGGVIYHVLNRGVGKTRLFRTRKDHEAFQRCLNHTMATSPMRVLGYSIMPTHWHLLVWPEGDGELARFMMRLTNTHVRRWLTSHGQVGSGHLYQGRYKSFAMQGDEHLLTVDRYVARNALRARLVTRAELWPWGSVGQSKLPGELQIALYPFPLVRRADWLNWVNQPQTTAEEEAVRECIRGGRPFGSEGWLKRMAQQLGWRQPAPRGRPRKK